MRKKPVVRELSPAERAEDCGPRTWAPSGFLLQDNVSPSMAPRLSSVWLR